MPLRVRWALDHPMVSNVSVGCGFDGPAEDDRMMLPSFLASKLAVGQGSECGMAYLPGFLVGSWTGRKGLRNHFRLGTYRLEPVPAPYPAPLCNVRKR